ncbi:MAG: ABC transporter substrate binding protein [Candidatus Thiodiazotropha sp. DIVDIV]
MKRISELLTLLLLLCFHSVFVYAETTVAKILVVHSYGSTHVCGKPQGDGVARALEEHGWRQGENLELRSVFMDTKKNHTTPEAIREQGNLALQIVEQFNPQVVIVLDDNAIREVMLPLVNRNDLSIVFSGMNGQPAEYNRKTEFLNSLASPGHNVTGVYEKLHLVKSLRVMAAAIGDIEEGDKVVGITDYSPTGNAITKQFEIELEQKTPKLKWDLRRVRNFEEYKGLINELNQDPKVRAIYPAALKLLTVDGQTYTAGNIFKWTTQNSLKPEMALNYYFSKIGLFGGAAVDFTAMGYMAGKKAAQILGGTSAGQIPIEDASDYAIVFNLQRAETLDIEIPDALLTAADQVYKEQTTK